VAETFKLIKSCSDYNIFSELTKDEHKVMRKRIIECVLATDMTFHAKQFTYLKLKIEKLGISKGNNLDKLFENSDNVQIYSTQQEFMNIMIHTCDISNPTKPWDIYNQWVDKVMEEFWKQGDREKKLNLPVSFLCDRVTVTKAGAQIGFIDGIILPFLTAFTDIFPELSFLMENAVKNKNRYKEIREEENKK
jgi:cAMP-specific phosphodiesterase 4